MKNLKNIAVALFDSVNLLKPNDFEFTVSAGNHYAVRILNFSTNDILVNGVPLLAKSEFVDEKPPVVQIDAFEIARSQIGYDIQLIIPESTDLNDIYIQLYYFAGVLQ